MSKAKPLRGCSSVRLPDGTVHQVRDLDGNLVIDPVLWADCQRRILDRVGKHMSELVSRNPERAAAYGLSAERPYVTMTLGELLGAKEKAPDSAATPSSAQEK